MRMRACLLVLLSLLFLFPVVTASPWSLAWEHSVQPGYITTSPVVDDGAIYVRSSGFWTGEDRPSVTAFDLDGEVMWSTVNQATVQHDMSPLLRVPAGQGACGVWPELLMVGWANGEVHALHPSNGSIAWRFDSTLQGWGVTGAMALDGDHIAVPTRDGLTLRCLADGTPSLNLTLGEGWRNGVAVTDDGYYIGDEAGQLWKVARNGTATVIASVEGAIRHAPVIVPGGLLVHVQHDASSDIVFWNSSNLVSRILAVSGPSPAIPLVRGNIVVFGDSHHLTSVRCDNACGVVDQLEATVNGEMAWQNADTFYAPINTVGGGWAVVQCDDAGLLVQTGRWSTLHDGYGTSAPAFLETSMVLGNDAGVLMAYRLDASTTDEPIGDLRPLFTSLGLLCGLVVLSVLAKNNHFANVWKVFSVLVLVLGFLMLPDVSHQWATGLSSTHEDALEASWESAWPEAWTDTQVVVFETGSNRTVVGGLTGHNNVQSLTQAAADEQGWTIDIKLTSLGPYFVGFNGTQGAGWEYFVNGERGVAAIDAAQVESSVVLTWRLVEEW